MMVLPRKESPTSYREQLRFVPLRPRKPFAQPGDGDEMFVPFALGAIMVSAA